MKRLLVILIMCYGVLGGISAQISGVTFSENETGADACVRFGRRCDGKS